MSAAVTDVRPEAERRIELEDRLAEVLPVLRDEAREADRDAAFPVRGLEALRRSGLMGLLVPVEHGGLGGDLTDLTRVAADLAGECLSTAMIWAMHGQQVAAIVAGAQSPLREQLLPRIAAGEVYIGSVTSEKGKGGHLLSSQAPLDRDDDGLIVEREAPIVTGAVHADGYLITMLDAEGEHPERVTMIYADRDDLEVTLGSGTWDPMGMRATHSVSCSFSGTLPEHHVVGAPGRFVDLAVTDFVPVGQLGWAACWLGAARGALAAVIGMLRSPAGRAQFDLDSDLTRARIARARLELDGVAALLSQVIDDVRDGRVRDADGQLRLNGLKITAAERTFGVVDGLIDLVGLRHGYQKAASLPLERLFRDLRSAGLNYSNDRLIAANGALALADAGVTLTW